jgi:hypothetical protein
MGSTGSGGGSTANVFAPPHQGVAAESWGKLLQPLFGLSENAGAGTPGAWAYPQAQQLYPGSYNAAAQYLTGDVLGGQPTLYDQNTAQAIASAQDASKIYGELLPDIYNSIPGLVSGAGSMLGYLPQVMGNAFNPMYGQAVSDVANNPYYAGAMGGAQRAAALGGQGAENLYGMGQGIMMSGFDPQSALFNRGQQRTMDRANALNAMSGVGTSPYGAGTANTALTNFDLDWQDRQLGRQTSAAGAASPLFQAAPGLAASSAALPGQTYLSQIDSILKALGIQNQAGISGVGAGNALISGLGSALGQAQGLGQNLAQTTATLGGLPYLTGATIGSNAQNSIANLLQQLSGITNIGNDQFKLPMDVMGQLSKYMGMGQSASQLSGQLGQQGFNQTAQGIGGLLGGANTLFNPTSGMFPGTLGSLGGMMGIGAPAAGAGASFLAPGMAAALPGVAGGASSIAPALGMAAPFTSDRRLKRDISRIGTLKNGLPVYLFRYRWSEGLRVGLMADEVEQVHPEAVLDGPLGFKLVNYQLACQ